LLGLLSMHWMDVGAFLALIIDAVLWRRWSHSRFLVPPPPHPPSSYIVDTEGGFVTGGTVHSGVPVSTIGLGGAGGKSNEGTLPR